MISVKFTGVCYDTRIIVSGGSANENRRYYGMPPLIDWAHIRNDPWYYYTTLAYCEAEHTYFYIYHEFVYCYGTNIYYLDKFCYFFCRDKSIGV